MTLPFYTIGHSNRTLDELVAMLRAVDITLLVDIRKMTRSRANPQFNEATLPDALAAADIGYEHIAELGVIRQTDDGGWSIGGVAAQIVLTMFPQRIRHAVLIGTTST